MVKFQEAIGRKYKNTFVCKKCKTKIKAQSSKVLQGKIKCRRCGSKALRPVKKSTAK